MKMKVYNKYIPSAGFGNGVVLVAANSAIEAHCTCAKDENLSLLYNGFDKQTYETLENVEDWWSDYYPKEDWEEVPGLTYDGPEPKVIFEHSYEE